MNNYSTYRLNEICKISTGKWDANHAVENGRYRFYTCSNKFTMCDTASFNGECVIVPGNGDLGLLFYYNGEFDAYQRTYVLSDIKIYPKYLYYHMKYKWRNSTEKSNYGSTIKYVRITNFTSYEIGVPDIEIQRAIVARIEELFAELDKAVDKLKTARQQLKTYRQAVLNHWLNNEDGKWGMVKLGEVLNKIEAGKSFRCNEKVPTLHEKGIIKISAVTWGDFKEDECKTIINEELYNPQYRIRKGDLLMSRANTIQLVGNCVLVRNEPVRNIMLSDKVLRLVPNERIDSEFLLYSLKTSNCRTQIQVMSTGNQDSMRNIGQDRIRKIDISLPPLSEQQRIVAAIESRLSACESMEQSIAQSLAQAEVLRQSILKKAFSGELV